MDRTKRERNRRGDDILKYTEAKEVELIAKNLISKNEYLKKQKADEAKIYYLFKMDDAPYKGKCSLATGKWKYLTSCDFIIEINKIDWVELDEKAREALVYHELCHITYKEKDGNLKWKVKDHDIEEFLMVAEIYKDWREELTQLKDNLNGVKRDGNEITDKKI